MKKRLLSTLTALCLCLMLLPTAALADTGSATVQPDYSWYDADESEFTVSTAEQLLGFANLVNGADGKTATDFAGKTVKLGANIDLSGIANWTPIGKNGAVFKGTFDGQNHKISGLTVNSDAVYIGLFGKVFNATVQNLAVSGSVTGTGASSSVGGIIGDLSDGSIKSCSFSGSVTGSGNCVGGIAGEASGTISRCSNTATVSGSAFYLGGIVGSSQADIQYCCNQGDISSTRTDNNYVQVGGISGMILNNSSTINMKSCYNTGATAAKRNATYARIGGIVGLVSSGAALKVTNAYYLNGSAQNWLGETGGSVTGSVVGKDETAFSSGEVTYLLNGRESDGTCTWRQTLSGTDADLLPTLNNKHGVVYYGYTSCAEGNDAMGYGNSYLSSTARPAHQFLNGQCKNCTATFTITADKPSYTYGDTATLTVAMTGVTGEKTYQWSKQVWQDYNTISGATSETYTTPILTESGVYKCTVTITGVRTYGSSSITLTVNKKTATAPTLDDKSATYTGSPIEHELESLPTGVASAKYEYEGMNGTTYPKSETAPTAAGEYSVTVTFTMDEGYEQLAPLTSTLTISKRAHTLTVTMNDRTYGDTANTPSVTGLPEGVDINSAGVTVGYFDANTGTPVGGAPVNVGSYRVSIDYETDTDVYTGAKEFTIARKTVTVVPKSYTITKGDAIPTFELEWNGLVGNDAVNITPSFHCCETGTSTAVSSATVAGDYTIVWENVDDLDADDARYSNYHFVKTGTGTLTIQPKPSSGSSRPSYSVTAPTTTNGSVTVSPKSAKKGATVTVTVAPDTGYVLETLTILDKNGNAIELTDLGDGKYSFKMPAGKVSIEASFMDDNTMLSFFTDVPANAYYYDAVLWAARNGITGGIDENHFGPDLSCARAQLVTFLYRVAVATGADVSVGEDTNILSYTDALDIPEYAIEALQWAVGAGIVNGADGKLMPSDAITREQFVTILYRFAKSIGMDVSVGADTNILSYGDALEISEYAVEAMQWAVGAGIMQGYNGDLMPKDSCTRAQIVTMLYRLLGE